MKPYDEEQIADMLGRWLTPRATEPTHHSDTLEEAAGPGSAVPTPALDMTVVAKIRRIPGELGTSLLGQVASRFAANAGPIMAEMRVKARLGDSEAVWRGAHGLRSSAGAVGAYRVSQACAEIEALARDSEILPTETALAALESELAAANRDLKKLVEAEEGALDSDSFVAT